MKYLKAFIDGYAGFANYLWQELTFGYTYKPWYENYLYALLLISLLFFGLEYLHPWRTAQPKFRTDFWTDIFYMFFNFFLFWLIGYNAVSSVVVLLLNDALCACFGIQNLVAVQLGQLPHWAILCIGLVVNDFVQWGTHCLLHRYEWLWQFHKLHHSTKNMDFLAHLRYHWMETVVYRVIGYFPLALLGVGLYDFFIIHIFTLAVGHFNHSNIKINLGFLKYVFNNPQMHIWHHAKTIPDRYGVNFGITLSIWDYIFGTAYLPHDGRDIELGFDDDAEFPQNIRAQLRYGIAAKAEKTTTDL